MNLTADTILDAALEIEELAHDLRADAPAWRLVTNRLNEIDLTPDAIIFLRDPTEIACNQTIATVAQLEAAIKQVANLNPESDPEDREKAKRFCLKAHDKVINEEMKIIMDEYEARQDGRVFW